VDEIPMVVRPEVQAELNPLGKEERAGWAALRASHDVDRHAEHLHTLCAIIDRWCELMGLWGDAPRSWS
jgi:hypothetical protein